jgi:hypothetical protein
LEVTVKEKGKIIHVTGRGRRGAHIFYTVDWQMAVRLSALRAGRPLLPTSFLVLISSGMEPAPFRVVA